VDGGEGGNLLVVTPKKASDTLRKHFAEVSPEQFIQNVRRYSPELLQGNLPEAAPGEPETAGGTHGGQLVLFPQAVPPARVPLQAYLACALTGLSPERRQLVFQLSDDITTICKEYDITVYEPRKKTDPVHHPEVPDTDVFRIDRQRVLSSDLLILLTHYASFGAGEELDFAYSALVPILMISHSENPVSRMVTGVPSFKLQIMYSEPEDLRRELHERLAEIRPILVERKLAFSEYDVNLVGEKIRLLREAHQLTREEIAAKAPQLTVELLRQIEEGTDHLSNPSLLHLRQIAAVLKTTVADLVEPDLNERLISALQEWLGDTGRQAARFGGMSVKDRNRLLRRVLLRVIDSLENES
jgi:transcriptional regulator with XRE-family HTH domain